MTWIPRHRSSDRDDGFVIIPVLLLLIVALGLGFALLALVDTQSRQSGEERLSNSAQTLSEGVVAAAGTVMASDQSSATWPTLGGCRTYSHKLSETGGTATLEARIVKEVHDRFSGTSNDLSDVDTRTTTWTVNLCPVVGAKPTTTSPNWTQDAATWNPSNASMATYLQTSITAQPAGAAPVAVSMWARGQANVKSVSSATSQVTTRSRSVVAKLRQTAVKFQPPSGFALSTGGMSTDLTTSLSTTLFNSSSLVGGLTGQLLGTKSLIDGGKIGTRCTLLGNLGLIKGTDLSSLNLASLSDLCLSGTLSGVGGSSGIVQKIGLGSLNAVLGISNQETLSSWAMAPPEALRAYAAAAQRQGTYVVGGTTATTSNPATTTGADPWTFTGYGKDDTVPPTVPATVTSAGDCIPAATLAASTKDSVFYIKQVGNGEQYCTLKSGTAGIVVIERGAVRITGTFRGAILAANLQECGSDDTCDASERTAGAKHPREVVRIDGGQVVGAVFADGAGGKTGIYPPTSFSVSTLTGTGILDAVKDPMSPCGAPVGLSGVIDGLTSTLGGLLTGVLNKTTYTLPDGSTKVNTKPTSCELVKAYLAQLGTTDPQALAKLLLDGQTGVVISFSMTECGLLGLGAILGGCQTTPKSVTVNITAGAGTTTTTSTGQQGVLGGVLSLLTSTLSPTKYQAIIYSAADAGLAPAAATGSSVTLPQGASPVTGTYRNVASIGGY